MRQVQTISREVVIDPSETTRRAPSYEEIVAYLQGAVHDASRNKRTRIRFTQNDRRWLVLLQDLLARTGNRSWIYKEGKHRDVYALETLATFLDFSFDPHSLNERRAKVAYVRGFFDAEGGIPKSDKSRFYIQLVQKDKEKLESLACILSSFGIKTGKIHNPSAQVDPHYWRLFVSTRSHKQFASIVGSWHPRKQAIFTRRMEI